MTAQGHPRVRFKRAIEGRWVFHAALAAREAWQPDPRRGARDSRNNLGLGGDAAHACAGVETDEDALVALVELKARGSIGGRSARVIGRSGGLGDRAGLTHPGIPS